MILIFEKAKYSRLVWKRVDLDLRKGMIFEKAKYSPLV